MTTNSSFTLDIDISDPPPPYTPTETIRSSYRRLQRLQQLRIQQHLVPLFIICTLSVTAFFYFKTFSNSNNYINNNEQ